MVSRGKRKAIIYSVAVIYILIITSYIVLYLYKVPMVTNINIPEPELTSYFHINVSNVKTIYESYIATSLKYVIHYNYVACLRRYHPLESVTLTTQGDFRFLEDLGELTHRWAGPISVALYAPGSDWIATQQTVAYLRNCAHRKDEIRELVSFHLFAEKVHVNENDIYLDQSDCSSFSSASGSSTFRLRNNLTYPINTARNIARRAAHTYFVLSADLELFPSTNFIPGFMQMINAQSQLVGPGKRSVFVVPIFELMWNVSQVPETKDQLLDLIDNGQAFLFHEKLCLPCHDFPGRTAWAQKRKDDCSMSIFEHTKRIGAYFMWEPFYVGTNADPWFDERFTWEGQSNKLIQWMSGVPIYFCIRLNLKKTRIHKTMLRLLVKPVTAYLVSDYHRRETMRAYSMCLLNYTFLVLNNAFLVHKPGIKPLKVQIENLNFRRHIYYINDKLKPRLKIELQEQLGANKKCYI